MLNIFIRYLGLFIILSCYFNLGAYASPCLVRLQANDLDCTAGSACSTDPICKCQSLINAGTISCAPGAANFCNQHPICTDFTCTSSDTICMVEHLRKYAGCYVSVGYSKHPKYTTNVNYLENPLYNQTLYNKCTAFVSAMCSPRFGTINIVREATACNNNGRNLLLKAVTAPACRGSTGAFNEAAKECLLSNLTLTGCKRSICRDHSVAPYDDRTKYEPNPDYNLTQCNQCVQSGNSYCAEFGTSGVHLQATMCTQAVTAFIYAIRTAKDTDNDGVADHFDNCPFVFNPKITNKKTDALWQEDNDEDGIGCACDPGDLCILHPRCAQKDNNCFSAKPQKALHLRTPKSYVVPQNITP